MRPSCSGASTSPFICGCLRLIMICDGVAGPVRSVPRAPACPCALASSARRRHGPAGPAPPRRNRASSSRPHRVGPASRPADGTVAPVRPREMNNTALPNCYRFSLPRHDRPAVGDCWLPAAAVHGRAALTDSRFDSTDHPSCTRIRIYYPSRPPIDRLWCQRILAHVHVSGSIDT